MGSVSPVKGGTEPPQPSRFQKMVDQKIEQLQHIPRSSIEVKNEPSLTIMENDNNTSKPFCESVPSTHSTGVLAMNEASDRGREDSLVVVEKARPTRINPFENGYTEEQQQQQQTTLTHSPVKMTDEVPAAKGIKEEHNDVLNAEPACTCSISTECERAALHQVRDCRLSSMKPVPRRIVTKPSDKTKVVKKQYISVKKQMEIKRSNEEVLQILSQFQRSQTASSSDLNRIFNHMRDRVHYLHFYEIPPNSFPSIKAKFLDQDTGLPAILNSQLVPWDIRLDVEMFLMRLRRDDVDPDLQRGLIVRRIIQNDTPKGLSRSLDPNYAFKRSTAFIGEGHLRNGQWFPFQICAVRDGAHGEMEGGISGREGLGAVSIVLSFLGAGHAYADIDQGETIQYCGTRGKNRKASANTGLLLESAGKKNEIRVFRSAKLPKVNKYRPKAGIRYDGLYKVCELELLDEEAMLYRFKLQRVEGQTPIRFMGPEARPTKREIDELQKLQRYIAGTRPPRGKKT